MRRSAKVVGVVSLSDAKTLISPLFSATKTRPSAANRTTVGLVRPLMGVVSAKPAGSVLALADPAGQATASASATTTMAVAVADPDERGTAALLPITEGA